MSLSEQLIDLSDSVEPTQTSPEKEEIVDDTKQASPNEKQVHHSLEQDKSISQHEQTSLDNEQQDDIELTQDSKEDDIEINTNLQDTLKKPTDVDVTKDSKDFGDHNEDTQKGADSTKHVKEDDFGSSKNSKKDTKDDFEFTDVEMTKGSKDDFELHKDDVGCNESHKENDFGLSKDSKEGDDGFNESNKEDDIEITKNSIQDDFEFHEGNKQDDFEFNEDNKQDDFDFTKDNTQDDVEITKDSKQDDFEFNQDGFDDDDFDDFDHHQDNFDDFDSFDATNDDFDDFDATNDGFDDFEATPTEVDLYVNVIENNPSELGPFINTYLDRMWGDKDIEMTPIEDNKDILVTPCSQDLWSKLSRDTVFYNPVTGAVGQFQWTRSETNKAYLNALGVTLNYEDKKAPLHDKKKLPSSSSSSSSPSQQNTDINRISTPTSPVSRPASASPGLRVVTEKMDETTKEAKKEADQDMELDIDIARAYCELTEETIRVFPDVKLNAMVMELSRLQRQAADYLDHLLDQREQLKMDAETYNDLISCIVGHAQRLHVNNKDASPAMVSKKKKSNSGTFSNIMRRKTTTTQPNSSVSMGGGVVGVKQPGSAPKQKIPASESRRSM
ncbi:uncharacterized protein B0P05DRAFT_583837 [Gilbertella persicaria]|uniref:uncharacterized protein n=1 Tax=Gilbertella persicaria TaxID=101096 RepID=UPI002220F54D|nr:uncharacterized protein B0P05DRAFT_583837 [Gilbertella persicaria]KAI8091324.1 hypothetical protein B0P05DRAFT_583837 [Gilbertella persicaria]